MRTVFRAMLAAVLAQGFLSAQEGHDLKEAMRREILGPSTTMQEVQDHVERRILAMPDVASVEQWEKIASTMRAEVLEKIVYRGEAARWRDLPARVEGVADLEGQKGYRIRKLRYEAAPGLWIPALLYVPQKLSGKVPVHMAVSGHEKESKAVRHAQIRCINLARRGMIVLAPDWLGYGQLRGPGYQHSAMNQLDLCGTSGLAPFYLSLKRGLDVLLSLENADPARVAVHGLSGGGWQTIWITALDTRVTLANPVAGYSSLRTMTRHLKDLPDSEQAPADLALVTDYAHFTALCAPRPALLTYNLKDDCCYESGYALGPLLEAARPIYRLYGKDERLRSHVNEDPGNHNYGPDNRQAFYRLVGDHFFPGDPAYDSREVPAEEEVRPPSELEVELPKDNATFGSLARRLAAGLPRASALPTDAAAAARWQKEGRAKLRAILRVRDVRVSAANGLAEMKAGVKVVFRRFDLDGGFTVSGVELSPPNPASGVVLFSESGRAGLADEAKRRLAAGDRVVVVDPFGYGESKIARKDADFALLLAAAGERPLGIQAGQIAAIARWAEGEFKSGPVVLSAVGARASLVALAAAALEVKAIGKVELIGGLGSLKEILEQGVGFDKGPELFCFGLLEAFDVKQLVALVAPRPARFLDPSDRVRAELKDLSAFYAVLGARVDPLK